MNLQSKTDEAFMLRAIDLSKRGFPAPNPHVGCVITDGFRILGKGWHDHAGGPHADIVALKEAGDSARGATAYVTLEPCNHFGRTPPCTQALLDAGIKRVVVACSDPNPVAAGGLALLQERGIETHLGLLEDLASKANEMWLTAMRERRPYIVIKAAVSLDGRIALSSGESQWITGSAARKASHRLRAECGAVLVGRKTVEVDNPKLTARLRGVVNQPVRIVLDPSHRIGPDRNVLDVSAPTMHLFHNSFGLSAEGGQFDPVQICNVLFDRGIRGVLVEGGATTIAGFVRAGLVDRIELFMAPVLLGDGPSWMDRLQVLHLADAPRFQVQSVKKLSGDLQVTLTR